MITSENSVDQLLDIPPFRLGGPEKEQALMPLLTDLTRLHYGKCEPYRRVVDAVFGGLRGNYSSFDELPFIPVSLFKSLEMRSVEDSDVFRILTSSGTTGQAASRIALDRVTAGHQAKALVRIMQHFLGKERLPMVVLDHPNVIKDRTSFSARGAGILGLMQFGRQPIYAYRDDMSFDFEGVSEYLRRNHGQPVLFFGFTFMAWIHGIAVLAERGVSLPQNGGVLIHSGGWKKLEASRVDSATFSSEARRWLGVNRVLNFYGMVEQVGSVFFENPQGALHAPSFAHVIVRDPFTLKPLPAGSTGLIQVISVLPQSYPGNSLLTEDVGAWLGDGAGNMQGRYFQVNGRVPKSEVRGCSDTYETKRS